jgi:hypothetical protein
MRVRMMLGIAAVGTTLGFAAPAAHAFGVANNCTTPTSGGGTTLSPNQPCWVAGVYNDDYTGMTDTQYVGPPAQMSGGHPFTGVTDFIVSSPTPAVSGVRVDVPPGLVSNPRATPKCTDAQLASSTCPNNTQLGIVRLEVSGGIFAVESVYNMPLESSFCPNHAGVEYVSDFAFYVAATHSRVDICGSVDRQPPYNQYFVISLPPGSPATVRSTLIFWGVPGDRGHDPQRGQSCLGIGSPCTIPASGPSSPSGTPFITNPTACLPPGQATTLTLTATDGTVAAPVQSKTAVPAVGCAALAFSPKLKLQLKGRSQTAVGKHPTLMANLTQASGQANIAASKVALPLSMALDPKNSQHVCSPTAAFNDACPSKTVIGTARAVTPLLDKPLAGKVYLVQGIRCASGQPTLLGTCPSGGTPLKTEPALLVALRGQAMLDLHAQTSVVHNKLVTTFSNLPDLPDSSFQLKINGGKRGILVVTGHKNLCAAGRQVASSVLTGMNAKKAPSKIKMATPCKKH